MPNITPRPGVVADADASMRPNSGSQKSGPSCWGNTGTAVSGRVAVGDRVLVSPRKLPVRVRGLHAQNRESQQGLAGQRGTVKGL